MAHTAGSAWLSLSRASALGWAPIAKKQFKSHNHNTSEATLQSDVDNFGRHAEEKRLIFNVSGRRFEVSQHLIDRYPYTLLGSKDRELFFDFENQEYFFDRDPDLFRYVLFYYRNGHTHYPKNECSFAFQEELTFFRLDVEDLSLCCYEEFQDCHQDTKEKFEDPDQNPGIHNNVKFEGLRCKGPRYKIWEAFENPESSIVAQIIYYVSGFFIAASVAANIVETIEIASPDPGLTLTFGTQYESIFVCSDAACVLIFTVEYLFRLIASPDPCKFMRSVMSLIDIVAILPFYIGLVMPDNKKVSGAFTTLRVFRVFRIFKFSRHSAGLRILGNTLKSCASELGFLLFSLAMAVVIFSTIIFYLEKSVPETNFTSIPAAFWYTIVTMTTLGYGDMVPKTPFGRLVGSVCSLSGVLVIALPVPVIVSNFSRIYTQSQRSDKRKEQKKIRLAKMEIRQKAIFKEINNISSVHNMKDEISISNH